MANNVNHLTANGLLDNSSCSSPSGSRRSSRVNAFSNIPRPVLIGVGGGTASGKSSVCKKIIEELGQSLKEDENKKVVIISQDTFYKTLSPTEVEEVENGQYNFDHPDAFDFELMNKTLRDIKEGKKTVRIPAYDHAKCCRKEDQWTIVSAGCVDVVLFEGILVFYDKEIRDLYHMKLFVDTDPDTRLSRRVLRDVHELNRTLDQVLHQYTTFVKPAFEEFCLPTKKYADIIIPRGADNKVAIDLIVQHVQEIFRPNRTPPQSKRTRQNSDSISTGGARPH